MIDTWGRSDDFGIYFSFINEKYEDLLRFFSSKEISNFKLLSDVYKVKIKHFDSKHTQKTPCHSKLKTPCHWNKKSRAIIVQLSIMWKLNHPSSSKHTQICTNPDQKFRITSSARRLQMDRYIKRVLYYLGDEKSSSIYLCRHNVNFHLQKPGATSVILKMMIGESCFYHCQKNLTRRCIDFLYWYKFIFF